MRDEQTKGDRTYSLKELCRAANVTERTVRYYKEEGLLPASEGAGPFARYSHYFLLRLLVIRRLKAEYLPLSEIKRRLDSLSPRQLEDLLESQEAELVGEPDAQAEVYDEEEADARYYLDRLLTKPAAAKAASPSPVPGNWPSPSQSPAGPSSRARDHYVQHEPQADDWKRLQLSPGVELHFRPDPALDPTERDRLAELLEQARRIFRLSR